jgi:penicillin-binding protein 2
MIQGSIRTKMLEAFRRRMYFFMALSGLVFFVLIMQVVNLQIVQGSDYQEKARLNMESYLPIPATRGDIYDRNFGAEKKSPVLVSNRPSFNISTVPAKFKNRETMTKVINRVCRLLVADPDLVFRELKKSNPWERVTIKEDVPFDVIVKIASHHERFPNIEWEDAAVRVYGHANMFAHIIGYIGSISKEEYAMLRNDGYRYYQKVGKFGIEKQYDRDLRGADGHIIRIVDVKNRMEGERIGQQPKAGNNIVMTVDYELQKTAWDAMGEQRGAVVALKPSTGEVLALLSKPDFDPNQIIAKDKNDNIALLMGDKNKPFLNRVIQAKYPPASTFKIVTAVAALETEKAQPNLSFHCPGKYTLRGYTDKDFFCYGVHGTLDLYYAIAKSCSVYFYQLGYRTGPTIILRYADYFGLNEKTGIDLPGEHPGFIPSMNWKHKTFGQPWFDGDTLNLSIGQGFLNVTPIGMAQFLSALVNNGIVYKPRLIKEVRSPDNSTTLRVIPREKLREIPLSPSTLRIVKQGMRLGVTTGTSGRLGYLKTTVAGKTGTAQTRSKRKDDYTQHAWFVGYAPFDGNPENAVVVAVLVEYGVAGAATAVPIAEKLFARMCELGYFTPVEIAPSVKTPVSASENTTVNGKVNGI